MNAAERVEARRALLAELDRLDRAGDPPACWAVPGPDRGPWTSDDPTVQAVAAAICAGCPALDPCRAFGATHPTEAGVYGGLTEHDRRRAAEALEGASAW